jgi:hypothetical protein
VARADHDFRNLGLSESSVQFLTACLDPFHDGKLDPRGVPDHRTTPSITQEIRHSTTITAPPLAVDGWSACVWSSPIDSLAWCRPGQSAYGNAALYTNPGPNPTLTQSHVQGYNVSSNNAVIQVGSYNVWTWPTGQPASAGYSFFPEKGKSWVAPTTTYADCALADNNTMYLAGPAPDFPTRYRIFASGVEVINTSSALNKQGALAVVRTSSSIDTEHNLVAIANGNGNVITSGPANPYWNLPTTSFVRCRMPPATLAEADTSGAVRWDASEGCYSVNTYEVGDLPFTIPTSVGFSTCSGERNLASAWTSQTADCLVSHNYSSVTSGSASAAVSDSNAGSLQAHHFSPRDNICMYLTGLAANSTFTVTFKYYVEMAPTLANPTAAALVPLLRPSPLMDEPALIIQQRASARLLPGVPAHMNSFGDFFTGLFNNILKPIASSVLPGVGPLLLNGAAAIANKVFGPKPNPPKPKKKQQPKSRPTSARSRASSASSRAPSSKAVIIRVPKRSSSASTKMMQFPRSKAKIGGRN